VARTLREVIVDFLAKPGIGLAILFIVLFRFAEGQVQTIGPLFLIEPRAQGGLGLSTEQVGGIYGTAGTAAFLVGSILGGSFTAWLKLRRAMPVLILAMAVPNAAFYYLSLTLPTDLWHIGWVVAVEMAGYGFGFVGMILFIMQAVAPGRFQTAHYALGTGVMQLGFILSKTLSGDGRRLAGSHRSRPSRRARSALGDRGRLDRGRPESLRQPPAAVAGSHRWHASRHGTSPGLPAPKVSLGHLCRARAPGGRTRVWLRWRSGDPGFLRGEPAAPCLRPAVQRSRLGVPAQRRLGQPGHTPVRHLLADRPGRTLAGP
jgi:hypothetical protein